MKKTTQTNGFTLIETLVSLLLVTVGILSFALLQAESMKATHSSMKRTKAIHFASDMLERIRSNTRALSITADVGGVVTPVYNVTAAAVPATTEPAHCSDSTSVAINCTPTQLAAYDIWEWKSALTTESQGGLSGGTGAVTVTGTGPYTVNIVIGWNDRKDNNSYTLSSVVLP